MGLSLYELTEQEKALQEMLESGEIDETTFADTLESLDTETKLESICKVKRMLEAKAKMFKEEKERIDAKKRTAENGVKRLNESLLRYLTETGKKKAAAGLFTVSKGSSKSVNIIDIDEIPVEYLIPKDPDVDKKAISLALKSGMEVPGVELKESEYVTVR